MATYLHQILAIVGDQKGKTSSALAKAAAILNDRGRLTGLARNYTPIDEDGIPLPSESTRVQVKAKSVLHDIQGDLASLFDIIATQELGNCQAKADIVVDGKVLVSNVPATYLLFLEKQLSELLAFVKRLPVLDPVFSWSHDESQNCWISAPIETISTKKIKCSQKVFEGNQWHAPQFTLWDEDAPKGKWSTLHYSGALQQSEVDVLIIKIEALQKAVKFARESANRQEVEPQRIGSTLLHHIFS